MKNNITSLLSAGILGLSFSGTVIAAPVSGQGSWESTLQARDLDGDLNTTEAFYDTILGITWLADAALSKSETFGVSGIVTANTNTKGRMEWSVVADWIAAMNVSNGGAGYLGQTSWRVPTILGDKNSTAGLTYSNPDTSRSELASLYYDTLGNYSNKLDGGGLTNTAGFDNMQKYYYATDTTVPTNPAKSWSLAFHGGYQYARAKKGGNTYSFAVLDGDIGASLTAVPLPPSLWLLATGLLGLMTRMSRRS